MPLPKGYKHSEEAKRKISEAHKNPSKETRKKKSIAKKGSKNPLWKGGYAKHYDGRISVRMPEHPFARTNGYIFRSHLIMEKMIGRYLTLIEVVHHKGIKYPISSIKNKQDDRPENLMLFPNNSAHIKFHRKL